MRIWIIVGAGALIGAVVTRFAVFPTRGARHLRATAVPTRPPTPGPPRLQRPSPLPPGELSEEQLRRELVALREELCTDLQYIAAVILNTGILPQVPPRIQQQAGLRIDELEALETQACIVQAGQPDPQNQTTAQLLDNVRTIQWLVKLHLAAMDDVTLAEPRLRPVNAEGSFRAFLELHDMLVAEMRREVAALSARTATLDDARRMGTFWTTLLAPHARAEERALFPLARSLGAEALARSADLLESEHRSIDDGIARYVETLRAAEKGQVPIGELVAQAGDLRGRTELHFGKEEESLIRPLQQSISSDRFEAAVAEQDKAVGPWLREHGWNSMPPSR